MEQLNFNFGLGGALPKGYTLSSYTFGQAINTIDIESVNIPENVKVILNTFISNDKIMNVPLSNNKALLSYFKIIKKFNVKPKADFLDFLVTREYISEFPDNNPTKESEVAVGILDSYIENTSGQVMANGGGVGKKNPFLQDRILAKEDIEILGVDRSKINEREWQSIFRMANYQDGATFILKNEKGLDYKPQIEYEWYVKEKMFDDGGGVGNTEVGEWRKGSSIDYKTKKEASDRLKFLKNYPNEYKNLRIIKTDAYNPYSVKFEFFKKDDNYSNGGEVKNKKLENIKNRLFAKHKK